MDFVHSGTLICWFNVRRCWAGVMRLLNALTDGANAQLGVIVFGRYHPRACSSRLRTDRNERQSYFQTLEATSTLNRIENHEAFRDEVVGYPLGCPTHVRRPETGLMELRSCTRTSPLATSL